MSGLQLRFEDAESTVQSFYPHFDSVLQSRDAGMKRETAHPSVRRLQEFKERALSAHLE